MFCLCPCGEYCFYLPCGSRRGEGKWIWSSLPEDPQLVWWDWFWSFVGPASDWGAHCFAWLHLFLWFCRSNLLGKWLRGSNDYVSPFLSKDECWVLTPKVVFWLPHVHACTHTWTFNISCIEKVLLSVPLCRWTTVPYCQSFCLGFILVFPGAVCSSEHLCTCSRIFARSCTLLG